MSSAYVPSGASGAIACHICETGTVDLLPAFTRFSRVTSDQRLWPAGGKLGVCRGCGGVQKVIDQAWRDEIDAIYRDYKIYLQSGGTEQATFGQDAGPPLARSSRLLERFLARFPVAETGRLLDVGCGNGAFLRAFAARAPGWVLAGTEWDGKDRDVIEAIPGVQSLYTVAPAQVPGVFDLVSMIHVLEHIPHPRAWLAELRAKLRPEGLLLIEVPDHRQNPFELTIADHSSHFALETLAALLLEAGYEVLALADDWIARELSVVARPLGDVTKEAATLDPGVARRRVEGLLEWLQAVASQAREAAAGSHSFGLFGTANAASWVAGEVGDRVEFFVDEDPSRVGRSHLGRPIYAPAQVPAGSHVFVPLPVGLASVIAKKFGTAETPYTPPPPLRDSPDSSV